MDQLWFQVCFIQSEFSTLRKIIKERQIKAIGSSLLRKIEERLNMPEESFPSYPRSRRKRIPSGVAKRIGVLREWRGKRAEAMDMEPSLLCTNSVIQSLAFSQPIHVNTLGEIEGLRKWQIRLFGNEVCDLFRDLSERAN